MAVRRARLKRLQLASERKLELVTLERFPAEKRVRQTVENRLLFIDHALSSQISHVSVTIRRASAVARSRSLPAPVLISAKTIASAACPPSAEAMFAANWLRV